MHFTIVTHLFIIININCIISLKYEYARNGHKTSEGTKIANIIYYKIIIKKYYTLIQWLCIMFIKSTGWLVRLIFEL